MSSIAVTVEILSGEGRGQRIRHEVSAEAPLLIGRGEECTVPLWDESASRRHALVERRDDSLWLVDLGSANGTWVGEERIERRAIEGGERIRIGSTDLRVETDRFRRRDTAVVPDDRSGSEGNPDRWQVLRRMPWDHVDLAAEAGGDDSRAQRLNALLERIHAILEATDGPAILRALVEGACPLLEPSGDRDAASSAPSVGGCAVPCAARTGEPLWSETIDASRPDRTAPPFSPRPSRTLVERVRREREAILVTDPAREPGTRSSESIVSQGVGAWIAVPVMAHDTLFAVALFATPIGAAPFSADRLPLATTLGRIAGLALAGAERLETSQQILAAGSPPERDEFVTEEPAVRACLEQLDRFAEAGGPLLIVGETGTGKELLARRAHRAGPHPHGPWIAVNCAALPAGLLESELFGHEEGAFTGATARRKGRFELADGGTIFLDEIGELPVELQPKLLRVLESGEFYRIGGARPVRVEVLVLSATHRDLDARVASGEFREDLLHRLGRFRVTVSPLRARPRDLEPLVARLLDGTRPRDGETPLRLTDEAFAALRAYRWPGNVRELRNVLERAAVIATGPGITASDLALPEGTSLALGSGGGIGDRPVGSDTDRGDTPPPSLREVEEAAVRAAMRHTEGHRGEAARLLGVSEPTLRRKLRAYGLDPASDAG